MRHRFAILLFLTGAACSAHAAIRVSPVSVDQLQQWLVTMHGKSDGKIAGQLMGLELTERVSAVRLAQWEAECPGKRTREVLTELADAAAFLDLPAGEILPDAAPDLETQRQLLEGAILYVHKALSKLPNFYATRETTHFEDILPHPFFASNAATGSRRGGSRAMGMAGMTASETEYQPLHKSGVYRTVVRYRDGVEVSEGDRHKANSTERGQKPAGLTTSGEFGPILYVVVKDSLSGKITWGHWEDGESGRLAVFKYSVLQGDSHYMVQLRRVEGTQNVFPAYHGEIAVDPKNGNILRLSVMSDMAPPDQLVLAAILVEYASVAIGDHTYICPVHGVALSRMPPIVSTTGELEAALMQTQLNQVVFKDYHLFRGDTRILTGAFPAPAATAQ